MKKEWIKVLQKSKRNIVKYYRELYPDDLKKADKYAKEDIDVRYINITINQIEDSYISEFDVSDRLFIVRTLIPTENLEVRRKVTDMMISNEPELWTLGLQLLKHDTKQKTTKRDKTL